MDDDYQPDLEDGSEGTFTEPDYSEADQALDYQATLAYTQRLRRRLVTKQTAGGVPGDKEGIETLLKTLKDMDSTAIADRRNSIDEGNADTAKRVADSMAEFIATNQNPFLRQPDGSVGIPTLNPSRLPDVEHVEGETFIGTISESEEAFTQRMQSEYDRELNDE